MDEYHLTLRSVHEYSFRLFVTVANDSCDHGHPGLGSLQRSNIPESLLPGGDHGTSILSSLAPGLVILGTAP